MSEFWAVTCYYNSEQDHCRVHNFKLFAERLKKQGVSLLTVELVVDDKDKGNPDVESLSTKYHRVVHPDVLWSKEALVNVGFKLLPPECTKVCWIDADILFPFDDDWATKCSAALDKHKVVQPFEKYFFMPERHVKSGLWDDERYPEDYRLGFAGNYAHGRQTNDFSKAHPGYAWAARRSVIEEIGGLYDKGICMADVLMAYGFIAKTEEDIKEIWEYEPMKAVFGLWGPRLRGHVEDWMRKTIKVVGGDVGVVDGVRVHHLFHGSIIHRKYKALHQAYAEYNPYTDSRINADGVLEWTEEAPQSLKNRAKAYMSVRQKANTRYRPQPTTRQS
jgi:hypothetical protein